jgi:hypothetical protein
MDRHDVNEFRLHAFGHDVDRAIAFICECADSTCTRTVVLTRATYDGLREEGKSILFPAHVPDEDAPLRAEQDEAAAAQERGPRSTEALEVETGS